MQLDWGQWINTSGPALQTHKPYSCWGLFPRHLASVKKNLPEAQHKLPGLSYLKGAF